MVYHGASIYLVMNFTRRTLMKVLEDSFLSVDEVRSYLTQILAAVAFLHANDIIHANLAPNHILVGQNGLIELISFEYARAPALRGHDNLLYMGFLWVQPPELILDNDSYSTAIDMWSVGCLMAEMLRGRTLFPGMSKIELVQLQFELMGTPNEALWPGIGGYSLLRNIPFFPPQPWITDYFPMIGKEGQDLLGKLLALNPRHRITAKRALDHPYLSSTEEQR